MVDHSNKISVGVLYDALEKADHFILPTDFVVLAYEIDQEILIILRRPFFAIRIEIIDMKHGKLMFRVQNN